MAYFENVVSTYTSPESLVEISWLAEHFNDPNVRSSKATRISYVPGFPQGKNYDDSWTEWGNSVRVRTEKSP
jgi:3-mercaptopyruvate sulfurtransferase SseA